MLSRAVAGEQIDSGGTLSRQNHERNNVSSQRACSNTAELNNGTMFSRRRQLQFIKSAHGTMEVSGISVTGIKYYHAQMLTTNIHPGILYIRRVIWITGGGM